MDRVNIIKSVWDTLPTRIKPLADNPLSRLFCGLILFGGINYYSHYQWLLKSQWWVIDRMEQHRLELLQKILMHSYNTVPFYRDLFKKEDIKPENIRCIEDFEKLPIITKEVVRRRNKDFISETINKNNIKTYFTGGSTGNPLQISYNYDFLAYISATERFIKTMVGFDDFSPRLSIPGNGPFWKRKDGFFEYNPVTRQLFVACSTLSEDVFKRYVELVRKFKPKYLDAHPSTAYYFAKFLAEKGISDISFDSILCTGEILHNFQRKLIQKQFNGRVFNYYGHEEWICFAAECEKHKGMHISEMGLLEIVDKNGIPVRPGKAGRIISTTLHNYVWPLIRYDTGDIGEIEKKPCKCGRGLLRIKEVRGRCNDMIKLPNGRIIPPNYFTTIMDRFSFTEQFQFVQEDENNLVLKIIKKNKPGNEEIKRLENHIKTITDNSISLHIECVDKISLFGRKNKYRYVISKL